MPERRGRPTKDMKKIVERFRKDPALWLEQTFGAQLWSKQEEILNSAFNNRYTTVKSAFGTGKSHVAAATIMAFHHLYPESLCISTAPSYRQLQNIWSVIHTLKEKAKAPLGSEFLKHEIRSGPKHKAIGFTTNMPERLQGMHAKHMLIVVDESAGIEPEIHDRLDALMVGENCHRLDIGNPLDSEGHFYDMFDDSRYNKITISAFDTPNVKKGEEVIPGMVTERWVEERREKYGEDSPMWISKVLGKFPPSSEDVLIPILWVEKAQELWYEMEARGEEVYGLDPSGGGLNESALAIKSGNYIRDIKSEVTSNLKDVTTFVNNNTMPGSRIYIDNIGVGWGVVGACKDNNRFSIGVNSKTTPDDSDRFYNLRAELYWKLRDLLNPDTEGCLALPPDETLVGQLTKIRYEINARGKIKIESKKSMKKRGMVSPDRADAVMLTMKDETDAIKEFPEDTTRDLSEALSQNSGFEYVSWSDFSH